MKIIDIAIGLFYWMVKIGWVIVLPACIIGFFAGGWFILAFYAALWAWVKDLRTDHKALKHGDLPTSAKLTREVDWALARTGDEHPASIVRHHDGTQDFGDINGPGVLGYPVRRNPIEWAYPPQMQCVQCRARFEPPYPYQCGFCLGTIFQHPSSP